MQCRCLGCEQESLADNTLCLECFAMGCGEEGEEEEEEEEEWNFLIERGEE